MGSNSGRKSASSGHSKPRKRVVIGADRQTVRVRYRRDVPKLSRSAVARALDSARAISSPRSGARVPASVWLRPSELSGSEGNRIYV